MAASVAWLASPGVTGAAAVVADAPPTDGRFFEPVFDEVEVSEDVVYGQAVNVDGELQDLHLDIYEPGGDTAGERPVLVLLHGGFFVLGDHKSDTYGAGPGVARPFVELGYVVVAVQYRLRPDMGFFPDVDPAELEAANLDAYDDLSAAIGWLRDHASEHRIDPEAIVPFGFSAGGAMAWNQAWMPGSAARPDAVRVPAAVSVAGAPLVTSLTTGEPLATPGPGDAPVLAYHGDADTTVPYELAAEPCARAAAAGVRCELVTYDGIGHPAIDPAFVPRFQANPEPTLAFLAEEVLVPLGYVDAVPPTPDPPTPDPPSADPSPTTDPPSPGDPSGVGTGALPVAGPARPVRGTPTFTG